MAEKNDVLVVAPATADLIAKFAHGHADDFLTTMYLAFTGKVVLAPAMNSNMWRHPATEANVAMLRKRGHRIVEPEEGLLACGTIGPGRLADPQRIADVVASLGTRESRSGRRNRSDHRRAYAGTARSGALYFQPFQRQNGLRAGGSGGRRGARK